jgi:hypothetical protein
MVEKELLALLTGELKATIKELEEKPSEIEEELNEAEQEEVIQEETPEETTEEESTTEQPKIVNVVRRTSTRERVEQSQIQSPTPSIPSISLISVSEFLEDTLASVCGGIPFTDVSDLLATEVNWSVSETAINLIAKGDFGDFEVPIGVIALVLNKLWQYGHYNDSLDEWLLENNIPEVVDTPDPQTLICSSACPDKIVIVIDFYKPYIVLKKRKECVVISPEDFALSFITLRQLVDALEADEVVRKAGLEL